MLLAVLVLATVTTDACSRKTAPAAARRDSSVSAGKALNEQILYYVNKYRASKGLSALEFNEAMNDQARLHSQHMANGSTAFGHDGFEGRVATIGKKIGRVSAAAENVAYGNLDAEGVVKGWINSPGHRKNMEGKYLLTGIGTADGRNGIIYFTQIFVNQ